MKASAMNRCLAMALVGLLALAASGCREHERGRVLMYEKGVYLGKGDTPLTAEQENRLRGHAAKQAPW